VSARTLVLLYHRVADTARDPYRIAIGPDRFAEHVELLASRYELVPFSRARERTPTARVVLTFDDGYVDNLTTAVPLLRGAPATLFVPSGHVGGKPFWWDRLERLAFDGTAGRERIEVEVAGRPLLADARTPEAVARLHWALYWRLRPLPPATVDRELDGLAGQLGADGTPPDRRPVTEDELRELAAAPGIEIGAHTVSHPLLTTLPPGERRREIVESRDRLRELTGQPVDTFSYPHGDVDASVEDVVRKAGFALACDTLEGTVSRFTPRHRVPRLTVLDWDGDELLDRIGRWLGT
jgi:peptidoglycan/xylan/chitin deacetylase (PgdA/CDA1 family)